MINYKKGQDRNQLCFTSLDMIIGEDNPVRLIDKMTKTFIEEQQILREKKSMSGNTSYAPDVFLNLYIYGYLNSISSSRKLEREARVNVELHWLLQGLVPDHWTINQFRKDNGDTINKFSKWFRAFLKNNNYIEGVRIFFDGTKVKAYASPDVWSCDSIDNKIDKTTNELHNYLESLKVNDSKEEESIKDKEQIEKDKKQIKKLEEKIFKLEQQKAKVEQSGKKYYAPNDPEATLVKSRQGNIAGYNGQIGVDPKHHFITTEYITDKANDIEELEKCVEATKEQINIVPKEVCADKGYANIEQILELEQNNIDCYIPLPTTDLESKAKKGLKFVYNKLEDYYTCPQGKKLIFTGKIIKQRKNTYLSYRCEKNYCKDCPIKAQCTTSPRAKTIKRNIKSEEINLYKQKIRTTEAKALIKQRSEVVEHPFGTMKMWMGKLNFLVTSLKKVRTEFSLYCTCYNLRRLLNITSIKTSIRQLDNYVYFSKI